MSGCAIAVRTALLFGLMLLSGCFDYTEEIKLDEKGGGTLHFVFNYGDLSLMERAAVKLFKDNPFDMEDLQKDLPAGVKPVGFREEKKDEKKYVYGGYEFDDLNKLTEWARKRDKKLFAQLSLSKVGDTWAFKRPLRPKDADELKEAKRLFDRSRIVLKVTGPGQLLVKDSNPTRVEGNTCVWEGSLPTFLEGPDGKGTEFAAQYYVGTPLWIKAVIGAGVLLLAVGLTVLFLRRKPASSPPAAPPATQS